jgi:hypothetical protein
MTAAERSPPERQGPTWYARPVRVGSSSSRLAEPSPAPVDGAPAPAASQPRSVREWDRIRDENWPLILGVSTVAAEICTLAPVTPLVRGPIVLWFCLVCTGMAWVRILRVGDVAAEIVAALALSVALSGLTSAAFLYAGHWSPSGTMVALEAITVFGIVVDRRINGDALRPPRADDDHPDLGGVLHRDPVDLDVLGTRRSARAR